MDQHPGHLKMKVEVRETSMVRPADDTPLRRLWNSDLDLLAPNYHIKTVYFYNQNESSTATLNSFFDANVLKKALGRVLVHFYPLAGRLSAASEGRMEINCNAEGALFVEAYTDSFIEDFGDLSPTLDCSQLIPVIDSAMDTSACPLLLLQVTYFKCGGVSLGVGMSHIVVDEMSGIHFVNSWSDVTRSLDVKVPPFIDRSPLRAQDPPKPSFSHMEYNPPPAMKSKDTKSDPELEVSFFKLTNDQLNTLKTKTKGDGNMPNFSSYVTVAGHVWRSVCKARELEYDQETKLCILIDARSRLEPRLPFGYFGNAIFSTSPVALAGDIQSKPMRYAARKINNAIVRMDNDYILSTIDYLALQPDITAIARGSHSFKCPNLGIVSWVQLPIYEADFGWGRPIYMGPAKFSFEGVGYVLPSRTNDDSLSLAICLQKEHMKHFSNFFYDI